MSDKRTKRKARKRQKKNGGSYQGAWRHVNREQQRPPAPTPNSPPGVPDSVQENARRYAQAYRRLIRRLPLEARGRRNCTLHLDPFRGRGPQRLPRPLNVRHPYRRLEFHDRRNDPLVTWVPGSVGSWPEIPRGPERRYGQSWHMSAALVRENPEEAAYQDFLRAFEEELRRGALDDQASVELASEVAWAIGMGEIRRSTPWKRSDLSPFPLDELRDWMIRLDAAEYFRRQVTEEGIGVRDRQSDGRYVSMSIDPQAQAEEIRRRVETAIARGERPRVPHRSSGGAPPLDRLESCLEILEAAGVREAGPPVDPAPLMPFFIPGPVRTSGWEATLEKLILRSLDEYRKVAQRAFGGWVEELPIARGDRIYLLYEVVDPEPNCYPALTVEYALFPGETEDRVERARRERHGSFFEDGFFIEDGRVLDSGQDLRGIAQMDLRGYPDEVPHFQENVQASSCEDLALLRRLVYYWLDHDRGWAREQWREDLRSVALG